MLNIVFKEYFLWSISKPIPSEPTHIVSVQWGGEVTHWDCALTAMSDLPLLIQYPLAIEIVHSKLCLK